MILILKAWFHVSKPCDLITFKSEHEMPHLMDDDFVKEAIVKKLFMNLFLLYVSWGNSWPWKGLNSNLNFHIWVWVVATLFGVQQ